MTHLTASGTKLKAHKEWRKEAKKARRKRIRQRLAALRREKEREREKSPSYLLELEKKRLYQEFELAQETKEREERHKKWLENEEQAQKKWREEQRLKKLALEERQKEQEKIRKEWENEQKKLKEQKERLEALKKEEERRQQEILERINDFIYNDGEMPSELRIVSETNPGKELCSFYQKVGACRFGNQCSRNHQYHKISNILLLPNFYTHFTLDQNKASEYDTDVSLEYEDADMYHHFKEFYNDVVPEFKRFGEVIMVKVCCNTELHLRGSVYIEYKTEREAAAAYQKFQGRWYGGKQLSIEFVKIEDWGSAVCGDFMRRRCPKGMSCNFLHVFKNPRNEFSVEWTRRRCHDDEHKRIRNQNWRWSESPSPSLTRIREHSINKIVNGRRKSGGPLLERRRKSQCSEKKIGKSETLEGKCYHKSRKHYDDKQEESLKRTKRS